MQSPHSGVHSIQIVLEHPRAQFGLWIISSAMEKPKVQTYSFYQRSKSSPPACICGWFEGAKAQQEDISKRAVLMEGVIFRSIFQMGTFN